jgi:hypothetical protein
MNRRDFQDLSRLRLREARALMGLRLPDGAYYLAGYAVECALKACIAKRTQRYEFPDKKRAEASYSHNLAQLLNEAGIKSAFADESRRDQSFKDNWDLVQLWSEQSRYETHPMEAAEALLQAINDRNHGVLACIRRHW